MKAATNKTRHNKKKALKATKRTRNTKNNTRVVKKQLKIL